MVPGCDVLVVVAAGDAVVGGASVEELSGLVPLVSETGGELVGFGATVVPAGSQLLLEGWELFLDVLALLAPASGAVAGARCTGVEAASSRDARAEISWLCSLIRRSSEAISRWSCAALALEGRVVAGAGGAPPRLPWLDWSTLAAWLT